MKKFISALLALSLMVVAFAGAALADDDDKAISVVGRATVQIKPDMAIIDIGVRETAFEVTTAQDTVNTKINAMVEALGENGIDGKDISTGFMSIYPEYNYDYQTGEQTFKGYTSERQLTIVVREMDKAGEMIDLCIAVGANRLNNITFTRQNNAEAVDKALTMAVEDAARKAAVVAAAAGVEVGAVVEISEDTTYYYDPVPLNRAVTMEDAAGDASTQVQAGMLDVTKTVKVVYSIK